jgi:branched-chain amino acid transport system ATP-binding protein
MLLSIKRLSVAYRSRRVLHEVSLDVGSGEIVSLLGSNASGKSTTIRTIIGLNRVVSGSVYFNGEDITGLPTHHIVARGISVVPENRRLFPRMTVEENLQLVLPPEHRARGLKASLESMSEHFPILREARRFRQLAGTLSGGEQQQIAMVRALLLRPKLLLLDEPSMGMSVKLVEDNLEVVREISRTGVGVLIVEQNVRMALSIAARGYVLQEGRMIQEGPSAGLLANKTIQHSYMGEFI